MNRQEQQQLERARQFQIHKENEAVAEEARRELSRVPCGYGCVDCDPTTCPHAEEATPEIPE